MNIYKPDPYYPKNASNRITYAAEWTNAEKQGSPSFLPPAPPRRTPAYLKMKANNALSDLQGAVNTERSGKPNMTVNSAIEQVSKMNPDALKRAHAALKATGLNEVGINSKIREAVDKELKRPSLISRPTGGHRHRTQRKRRTHSRRTMRRRRTLRKRN